MRVCVCCLSTLGGLVVGGVAGVVVAGVAAVVGGQRWACFFHVFFHSFSVRLSLSHFALLIICEDCVFKSEYIYIIRIYFDSIRRGEFISW